MQSSAANQVPLFAQYGTQGLALRSYSVPIHIDVAVHKLITFHVGLNGTVYYRRPGRLAASIHDLPEKYQRGFAELGTPRTWPETYDMQVIGKETTGGQCMYHLRGTPVQQNDIDYLVADVADGAPIKATWYLKGGGTIKSTFDMTNIGDYSMPKQQHLDIDAGGSKVHADITYGDYDLNAEVSDAQF
ncbi:MAG: hypothetical protein ACREMT_09240 [Vulcanimicrobiaceae bacterium]